MRVELIFPDKRGSQHVEMAQVPREGDVLRTDRRVFQKSSAELLKVNMVTWTPYEEERVAVVCLEAL